jgi:hypothetical protein
LSLAVGIDVTNPDTKEEDKKPSDQPGLTIGVIAGFTTLAAYLTAFMYEWGFTSRFGIPWQFITLDWTTVLIAAVVVLSVLWLIFSGVSFVYGFSSLFKGAVRTALMRTLAVAVLVTPLFLLVSGWRWWLLGAVLLLWVFLEFVYPYIAYRGKGTYVQRLELSQRQGIYYAPNLLDRLPKNLFLLLILLAWVIWLANSIGMSTASHQTEFLVVNTSPEAVVLRPYHDHLVCAYFDRETKEVSSEYFILKTAGDPQTTLTPEDVGPLHLKKN